MLASLFSKTKPINYIILTIFLVIAFVLSGVVSMSAPLNGFEILKGVTTLVFLIISLFLTQFIAVKNRLVRNNFYVAFFFVTFLVFFPSTLTNVKIVLANFFILLAFMRLFSLQSLNSPKEKLFDASLWILVGLLFHFWGIFFFALLFFSVGYYVGKDYRNWFIPIIALIPVLVFLYAYLIVKDLSFYDWIQDKIKMSFVFTEYKNIYENLALAVFTSISALFFFIEMIKLKSRKYNIQGIHKKNLIAFLIGVSIYVISFDKNGGAILFTFFPLSILAANSLENIPQKKTREVVVYSISTIALFFYLTQLFL